MRRRKAEGTKQRILQAAIAEYARYGLDGARVDRIAKRAKSNKRMIYYYFGTKSQLYREALNVVYQSIVKAMEGPIGEVQADDPITRIEKLIEAYFRHLSAHPEYAAMISWENLQQGRNVENANVERITHPMVERVWKILEENNLLPDDLDIRHYIVGILGLCFFYFSNQYTLSMIFGPDMYLEDEEKRYLESVKKFAKMLLGRRVISSYRDRSENM